MITIWKFETPFEEQFTLEMPAGAEILCVQQDQKTFKPCIWAAVNTEAIKKQRTFELLGTGHLIKTEPTVTRKYIGTYQYQKGGFVGHLFELINN